jgi:beta-glucosidase
LRLSQHVLRPGETLTVEAEIANLGEMDGIETAFLFMRDPVASVTRPLLELKGMTQLRLAAGGSGIASFSFAAEDAAFPDEAGHAILEPGVIELLVGPKADRSALLAATVELRMD